VVAVLLAGTPVAVYLALQVPAVQSLAVSRAARILSENLNTQVFVEKVYYVFFKKIILKNVHVLSTPMDTLLQVDKLSITLTRARPFSKNLSFQKLLLHGGVLNLTIEEQQTNLERVFKIKKGGRQPKDSLSLPWVMTLTDFSLKDFRFSLKNEKRPRQNLFPSVINFSDLEVSKIDIDVKNIRLAGDTLFCSLKGLKAVEKSGYVIADIIGEVAVSGTGVRIHDLTIRDAYSDLRADGFYMHYHSSRDFKWFTDSVKLEADFKNAKLSFSSLAHYAPALEKSRLELYLDGHIEGPVRHLQSQNLQLRTLHGETHLEASFHILGLPSVSTATASLDIHKLCSTTGDAASIIAQLVDTQIDTFTDYIPPLTPFHFEGWLAGLLLHFEVDGTLSSDIGNLQLHADLYQEKGEGFHVNGHIAARELRLGELAGKPFGNLDMEAHARTLLRSPARGGMEADIDSLRIHKIEINDYPFSNILAIGIYKDQCFDGRIACSDPNLRFLFQGLTNLVRYDFFAHIAYADLAAIGLDSRDSISRISGEILANFEQDPTGDIEGTIAVNRAYYTNSAGTHDLKTITLNSHIQDSLYRFELSAPFAEAHYTGSKGMLSFIKDIRRTALSRYLPHYFEPEHSLIPNQQYQLDMTVGDMRAIGQLVLPGLYIAPDTRLTTSLSPQDSLQLSLHSRSLRYYEQQSGKLSLHFSGDNAALQGTLSATELQAFGQSIDTMTLYMDVAHNQIDAALAYRNFTGQNQEGALNACIYFGAHSPNESPPIAFHIRPSRFVINNTPWYIDSSSVFFSSPTIGIERFKLHNGEQSLSVNGSISKDEQEALNLRLNQFDISLVNIFLEKSPYQFTGLITGDAKVVDFYQNRQFTMDMKGSNLFVNRLEAGDLTLACSWEQESKRFNINAQNVLQGATPVRINGFYYPEPAFLDLDASLQNFSVAYFEPFLSSVVTELSGALTGNMKLSGNLPNLSLTNRPTQPVQANNIGFTVNFTKVPYLLNGPISLHENGFTAQNAVLTDRNGNRGIVTGGMKYRFFRDISLDAALDFRNMQCLATKEKDNNAFYGDVFASGRLQASGSLRNVMLDILAKTERNSALHIPLFQMAEAKQSSLLSFVGPPDSLEKPAADEKPKEPARVAVKLTAEVTPDAELLIEINKAAGDVISGFGSGNIVIGVDPAKDLFDITGNYTITSGEYKFALQGIFSRKFLINPGGQISFNGDILKTNLNLTAAYHTKASLNTLLANNNAMANLMDVECLIHMSGSMMNPNLDFDIDVAGLAPDTKARVRAALSPQDKLIRQFMSLLVTGGFMPDQQSGVINNTAILYSNATEILSNQLNNIFGQLKIPLDVGFNYQPNSGEGRDIYDVAISMELFNKRLVVNGNAGTGQAAGATGDVAGNIDLEVKITDNGNLRAKVFSHAADRYSNYNDLNNTQRNGVGIIYQEEFNTFRELFSRIFGRKQKRSERQAQRRANSTANPPQSAQQTTERPIR